MLKYAETGKSLLHVVTNKKSVNYDKYKETKKK